MAKKKVVISILGTNLDQGKRSRRWDHWRPNLGLAMQEDLVFDRFELLYQPNSIRLARHISEDISSTSPETKVNLNEVDFKNAWDFEEVYGNLHDFSKGYHFNLEKEEYLIHITTGSHVQQICLFLLTESRHLPGKLIQTHPTLGENRDPKGTYTIIDLDLSQYDKLQSRFAIEQKEGQSFLKTGIDTKNKSFNKMIELIEKVAIKAKSPILLTGPTGAGKSQLAKKIYALKKQRSQIDGPLVEVNCATLRGDSAMATLFGHTKGAFTGAVNKREGLLVEANQGILFLDEIGELGLDEQAMLLTAIEEKSFRPVGSDKLNKSDFQLIAGTNQNLQQRVQEGLFREDLLSRINLWSFHLPGLKERPEDIAPNLEYEMQQYSLLNQLQLNMSREAKKNYLQFASSPQAEWKGNFRDLNASITRLGTLAEGGRITQSLIKDEIERLKSSWSQIQDHHNESILTSLNLDIESIDLFDRPQLIEVIKTCLECSSLSEAGRKLFAVSRQKRTSVNDSDRLNKYLKKFSLSWDLIKKQ